MLLPNFEDRVEQLVYGYSGWCLNASLGPGKISREVRSWSMLSVALMHHQCCHVWWAGHTQQSTL